MDLLGVLRACVRRWYVFLPILALTGWLCLRQYQQAVPQYTSTASAVIAPSAELTYNRGEQAQTGRLVTSPFAGGEGPRVLTGLVVRALNTGVEQKRLLPGGGAVITASRNVQEDATVVNVAVVSENRAQDVAAMAAVRQGIDAVARDVQLDAGAQDWELYTAVSGGPVDPPTVAYPSRVRGVVAIGLAGALVAVVLSVLAQSLLGGRRRRRADRPVRTGSAETPPRRRGVLRRKKRAETRAGHARTAGDGGAVGHESDWWPDDTRERDVDLRELERPVRSR